MHYLNYIRTGVLVVTTSLSTGMHAQNWEFAKEKDGISVYTRPEPGTNFKAFRGETEFRADLQSVCALIEDVEQFDDWDEDVSEIRVIAREQGKFFNYYVVYDTPWPFTDRDLCVEVKIRTDEKTGGRLFLANSAPDLMPRDPDLVRIEKYWQQWTVEPRGDGRVGLILEGYADPAGDVPAWLANMAITDTPLNTLGAVREQFSQP
jgi:hypothetical protein